jgi:hypothetical protein
MSIESLNIFTVKTVSFDQGERDPFGFDDFSEKLGAEYLPFSGTVSKPSYFLFVSYVTHILNNKLITWKNEKQKKEIQIRLEKLLVYCWKKSTTKEELRGSAIIGNSFDIKDIDVFSSKGWVKQNAFRIYNDRNFAPKTVDLYLKKIDKRHIRILNEFICIDFKNPGFDKNQFLKKIVDDLQRSEYSLFLGHKFKRAELKKSFKDELMLKIQKKNKEVYYNTLKPFFDDVTFDNDNFWKITLDNKGLPFVHLNNWFVSFVNAVDADINNKPSKQLWSESNKLFDKIPEQFHKVSKSDIVLNKWQKPKKWFQLKDKKFSFPDKGNKSENQRIKNLWDSYKKRQGEEVGTRYFFNYRHYALLRLLKELK